MNVDTAIIHNIKIRKELPTDILAIETLTKEAFENAQHTSHTEQFIVNALRKADELSVSLVVEFDGSIIGHVAVSPVKISDDSNNWYGLGPISVTPGHQNKGVGSQLIEQVLLELKMMGAQGCVVLGDSHYYGRFGFKFNAKLNYSDVPEGYFQALTFGSKLPQGQVSYHQAFSIQE